MFWVGWWMLMNVGIVMFLWGSGDRVDRFEHGLPDPQAAEVVDECLGCGGEIYRGQEVVKYGEGLCCNFRCLGNAMNAEKITAGE